LWHSKVQLRNKLDLLKGLYSFWLQLNKDTGLGWNEALGTVVAFEDYWNKVTKVLITCLLVINIFLMHSDLTNHSFICMQGHSNWKQLKKGPLDHEELLQEMFGSIVVDGSSACAPGEPFGGIVVEASLC
jgi:hypothetical protein